VGYDSTLLTQKLKDADSGNPNIYNSIEDLKADNKKMEHVYDEIKGTKVAKEDETEYDRLDHARATNTPKQHYTKMDGTLRKSKTKIMDSDEDNESTDS